MEGVAYRNLQNFSTNLKAGHEFDQRHLEAKFGQSKFSEPCLRRGKMDVEFFSIQHQFFPGFEFISKSYGCFTKPLLG
jgi:hypothetical protein